MLFLIFLLIALPLAVGPHDLCAAATQASPAGGHQKIGVLLVNHGLRSATWRTGLLQLESHVSSSIAALPGVDAFKTAFMEYTEPSIAARMKEFDREGYTDVIIVPVFLTVSPHTFDDIPTIVGLKEDPHSKVSNHNYRR